MVSLATCGNCGRKVAITALDSHAVDCLRRFIAEDGLVMKGRRPPDREPGERFRRRWQEIVAWGGFDRSDVPRHQRRNNLHLIVAAINALPRLLKLGEETLRLRDENRALKRVVAEAAAAIDVANGIIDLNVGTDTPAEWHRAFRRVTRARAAVPGRG